MEDISKYNEDGYNKLREFMIDLKSMNKADVLLDVLLDMKVNSESMNYDHDVIGSHGLTAFYNGATFATNNFYTTLKAALEDK